jgi:hypothetical protein
MTHEVLMLVSNMECVLLLLLALLVLLVLLNLLH